MPCVDVSDWHNGPRPGGALTCSDYQARGYCRHGQISRGSEWASGAAFHFPERGCCACGRSRHRLGHGALQNRSTGSNSSGMVGSSGSGSSGVLSLSGGSNQGRRESASSSGQCQCPGVSVCSNYSLAAFMLRMPKVISEPSSPWYDYLCTVYRTRALPLPLSLSILEAFYPALLPVPACTKTAHLSLRTERRWHRRWRRANISLDVDQKRACHKADCVAWLPAPPPTDAAARAFAVGRSYVRVPPQNGSAKSAFGHIVILQRPIQERRPQGREFGPQHSFPFSAVPRAVDSSSDAAWIEVSRTAFPGEGYRDYGCWFHPAVGTGVFLRRDRRTLLSWTNRRAASRAVSAWTGHAMRGHRGDGDLPRLAARRGYTSFEILASNGYTSGFEELGTTVPAHELVLMDKECMDHRCPCRVQKQRMCRCQLFTGCVPIETWTGWRSNRRCGCNEGSPAVINCALTEVL